VNNLFLKQFAENIKFKYTCFDRVVIRGYIRGFFHEGGLVLFLRAMGFKKLTNGVLRVFTDQLNTHIKKQADRLGVPIIWWPAVDGGKNGAKLAYVEKRFIKDSNPKGNLTYCIITDKETAMSFASKELTSKRGKFFRRVYKCKKLVKHYYIYFHDHILGGPCYLKISSYLPFPCEFYFNGHHVIKVQLEEKGIGYKMKGNAFSWVEDSEALQQIADSITGSQVKERIDYWMGCFFKFDKGSYSTRSKYLVHEWYMGQTEVCSNIIFKSARFCTNLWERLLDKFSRIGLPDSLSKIFAKRVTRQTKSTHRLYTNNACVKHWFRGNSIKMYNKLGYFLRIETTINNPKLLGLKKPVLFLQAHRWYAQGCNDRFADCCANIDLTSIAEDEPDRFTQPVLVANGKKVPAIDSRKDRQMQMLKELITPKYCVYGFRTKDLLSALSKTFGNSAQIRYELQKLLSRDMVKKQKSKSFYKVTEQGWKWMWMTICSYAYFVNPLISKAWKKQLNQITMQPSEIEAAYTLINQGLDLFTQGFSLAV
jgi:hypothetical protein